MRRVNERQTGLNARVHALEVRPSGGHGASTYDLEERLDGLKHAKLSNKLILFGVKELPSENTRTVATSIASALGVTASPSEISACSWIPAKGDRPRPIIVKLASNEACNRWIDEKRAKGVLESAEMLEELSGSRIDLNKRLMSSARNIFSEAKFTGASYIASEFATTSSSSGDSDTSPIRVRHREHLGDFIVRPPSPIVASGAESAFSASTLAAAAGGRIVTSATVQSGPLSSAPRFKQVPAVRLCAPLAASGGGSEAGRAAATRPLSARRA